jgi:glycosyltransferase involved in cell wall biosynthesis
VAVCSNRQAEEVAAALEEVASQVAEVPGSEAVLIASGVTGSQREQLEALASSFGITTRESGPGLSVARNAALALAHDGDIVAYLDDDALPAPGWLRSLAALWEDAAPDLACVGGAIEPQWVAPPPRWMSERVHVVFSLLDRGPGIRPLEPGVEDAWGANVSFRAGPLREAGGFDPSLGPVGGIPFFADETEAQRRLAAAGYRGIYSGDVRVRHRVGPERLRLREVLRRRFYAGAGMRRTGQWGLAAGVTRLTGGLAGAGAAFVRRSPTDLAVAIGRLGAGAGVLAEPLVRRRLARLRR